MKTKIISIKELEKFGAVDTLNNQALSLVEQQKNIWETAARNYEALNQLKTKTFYFNHLEIIAQFNPERIRSSAAKTDAKSIAGRPCFLCVKNLHPDQKGILFQNKYLVLANPYPIFQKHLTISGIEHAPQEILPNLVDLLDLSQNLPGFTVFYNGPQCGASAPDHIHFQAGNTGLLPIDNEFENIIDNSSGIFCKNNCKIITSNNYLRKVVILLSSDKYQLIENFKYIYYSLSNQTNSEPKMNIICNFINNEWKIIIFPREKQHPSHFFKTGEEQIIIGPAAVELGGILILPREDDFNKITKTEIVEIYNEVTVGSEKYNNLVQSIKNITVN
ncbi:MAG: DUF4922 domain-containing protein [Bacteroidales bacterium]|nr:DUF4922 domain-containing protein [Bacteroidales bacterium]